MDSTENIDFQLEVNEEERFAIGIASYVIAHAIESRWHELIYRDSFGTMREKFLSKNGILPNVLEQSYPDQQLESKLPKEEKRGVYEWSTVILGKVLNPDNHILTSLSEEESEYIRDLLVRSLSIKNQLLEAYYTGDILKEEILELEDLKDFCRILEV